MVSIQKRFNRRRSKIGIVAPWYDWADVLATGLVTFVESGLAAALGTGRVKEMELFFSALGPWQLAALFLAASLFMVWRLNAVEKKGFEGTLVGTLIMPYCSGFANLAFAVVLMGAADGGKLVFENCIVNNVTNLTLILGIPVLFKGLAVKKNTYMVKPRGVEGKVNYLSLLLSVIALLFFTGLVWMLSRDGRLDRGDGMVLVSLFFFWQIIHFMEVLKTNARKKKSLKKSLALDFIFIAGCAWASLYSIDSLVTWVSENPTGFFSRDYLGILTGFLMVIPNGVLALYYAGVGRPDIAYSSQVGDCHICIPLCLGLSALAAPVLMPASNETGILVIAGVAAFHFLFVLIMGDLPRWMGLVLIAFYGFFLYQGLLLV